MDRWKAEQGRGREKRKIRRKKMQMREKAGQMRDEKLHAVVARSTFASQNVKNTRGSDHFWKLRCRKSARRCGAKHISKSKCTKHHMFAPLLKVRMLKKCTPLWREAHFQVKMHKTPHVRATFEGSDVEKVHAVVARSTFPSQNVQNTTCSRHFWRFGCWKSARRCGAKHISKPKCTKHHMFAPLLEVRMLQTCTPLWREAHLEVKMHKIHQRRTTFGGSDVASLRFTTIHYITLHYTSLHYTTLHCLSLHFTTLDYITLHYTTLHSTTLQLQLHNYTPLHSTTLHYTTLHYTTLHSTTPHNNTTTTTQLHSTTLNDTTLHYITLHSTTLHYTTLHYLPLHFTTLHYTTLHYTTTTTTTTQLHSTTLHYTPLHYNYTCDYTTTTPLHETTLHYITLHYTTFHYTPLHYTTLHDATLHWMTLHHR